MTIRVLTKALAGLEDILFGSDSTTQTRNGSAATINRIPLVTIFNTAADMAAYDMSDLNKQYQVAIVKEAHPMLYFYFAGISQAGIDNVVNIAVTGLSTGVWRMLHTPHISSNIELSFKGSPINTDYKYQGKQAFNTSTNQVLYASGYNDVDPWVDAQGVTIITPV